jgi:L-alanine-DL-glutamate epimerase-like enolase superfamily enzyme
MRIREIRVYHANLPVTDGEYRMALSTVKHLESTVVEMIAEDGTTGWGETCPLGSTYQPQHMLGARAAIAEIAPGLVGFDVDSIRAFYRQMDARLNGHNYAKAALDIAAHDMIGRKLGVPVSSLLGGALTDRIPSYYSLTVTPPDKVRQGYARLQIKIGAGRSRRTLKPCRRSGRQSATAPVLQSTPIAGLRRPRP